jgi:chromosome segregation ATPase
MTTLYELTGKRLELQKELSDLNFDSQTIQDTLEGESKELEAKIEDYGYVIRNMDSFVESMKAEEDRMAARRKAYENKVERIKKWLFENMVACEITKIECPAFTISVATNPPKTVADDETLTPKEFMVEHPAPAPTPDKKAILAKLKAGEAVPGWHMESGKRLVIK